MDVQELLEKLLQEGRELAEKGQNVAEDKLDIPESGPQRDAMIDGLKKGALAAGGLALLLGTRGGRRLTGGALKLGSIAALGGLAYNAWKNWRGDNPGKPVDQLSAPEAEDRSRLLLRAMIAAAKANGEIDDAEQARIEKTIADMHLKQDDLAFLKDEIHKDLDLDELASDVNSPAAAAEVYLVSRVLINDSDAREIAYLDALCNKLDIDPEQRATLDTQIR